MATNKNFEVKNGLSVGGTERISSAGAFSGSLASGVTATTQSATDNSTKIATTAYTDAAITAVIGGAPGTLDTLNELAAAINDDASYATTLTTALATKLPLAGGTLTGNLTVPYLATTSYIDLNNSGNRGKIGWSGNHTYIATTSSVGSIIFKNNVGSTASPQTGGDTLLTIADGGNATFTGSLALADDKELRLGNSTDIKFKHHNSGYGHLENTGILYIDAEQIQLRTDNSDVGLALTLNSSHEALFAGKVAVKNSSPQYDFDITSTDDISMRIHRPSSGLADTDTCGIGFSQRGDTNTSSSDTRAGIFSTYNGNLFLATEAGGNLNSNPYDHARLYIGGNGQVWAGAVTTGSVATHGVIASSAGQGNLGTTLGDSRRAFAVHGLSQNSDYLTFRNTRITNGQSGWNHSSWEITRDIDNTSKLYNYVSFGVGTTVFNEDGGNLDFRVESDEQPHMLFVSAGSNQVIINDNSSNNCGDTFHVKQLDDRHGMGMVSHGSVSATGPAQFVEGVISMSTVSAGNKISIPITTQSNLWRRATIEIMVQSSEYNQTVGNRGGTAAFTFGMLSYVNGMQQLRRDGNISSITASGANIEINFTTGFTGGLSNYEGCMLYYKILSDQPDYVQVWNATLN